MSPEERAQLASGRAYIDPTTPWRPLAERTFGSTLHMTSQSYQDITPPGQAELAMARVLHDLYEHIALMGRRITLLEAQNTLLWSVLGQEL